jgi:SAM-dependent methyltransferase
MDHLLGEVRLRVARDAPQLLPLLDVFAQEARFARDWLDPSLEQLGQGENILEVGAGLMLVSCQLVREGYRVTALEPVGEGFSAFTDLQTLVLSYARECNIAPRILPIPVEQFDCSEVYGLAFSVNVMEHVGDVAAAIRNVGRSLRCGCTYRFTCPNYLFPYEPHFNIPTLFSKSLTGKVMRGRILRSRQVQDQVGLWRSLNWISVPMIRNACQSTPDLIPVFDRSMLGHTLRRVVDDPVFASRRSAWVRKLAKSMVALGLDRVLGWLPAAVQPVIDCTVTRNVVGRKLLAGRGF